MCGIAGLMTRDGTAPPPAVLDALAAALAHRGPDGQGRHVRDDVGMVQTRLAIIDLTTGDQPLFAPDGCALVANGEVYNYRELHAELAGAHLRTRSDCEPPLHLYCRHDLAFAGHLRGMYAIAIHDPGRRRLVLVRDPFGIKPLYYAETPQGFAFASEPQALVAAGLVAPRLNEAARDSLLQLQFASGLDTMFAGIRRVAPGETLVVEQGRVTARHRRPALPGGGPKATTEAKALADLDDVLTEAVELHQRADVPYGMFLSGGIDSSVVLALMARLNPRPVLAFTAAFPGTGVHDERAQARAVARAVGAEHVEIEVTAQDFWTHLPAIAACVDDPAADYAIVPTWLLARRAAQDVKVILSGEGGDELFAGYGRYRGATRPWPFAKPMRRRGTFDGFTVLRDPPQAWRRDIAAAEIREKSPDRSRLQVVQAVDCAEWLPNDLLVKADRCLMAHGIEGRVPFLDPVVAALAFTLPDRLKLKRGLGKWILRRWLETGLPAAHPFAAKRGFTVPVGDWMRARPDLGPLLARQDCIQQLCRPGTVERLLASDDKAHAFAAWTLLFYALWHRRHMRGLAPVGDVFACLAAP